MVAYSQMGMKELLSCQPHIRLPQDSIGHNKTQSYPSGLPSRNLPASPDTPLGPYRSSTVAFTWKLEDTPTA